MNLAAVIVPLDLTRGFFVLGKPIGRARGTYGVPLGDPSGATPAALH